MDQHRIQHFPAFPPPSASKEVSENLVIGNESWILYENNTRTAFWIARGSEPPAVAKPDLHPRKILLCYWWDPEGILYSELLPRSRPPPTLISSKILLKSAEKIGLNV